MGKKEQEKDERNRIIINRNRRNKIRMKRKRRNGRRKRRIEYK